MSKWGATEMRRWTVLIVSLLGALSCDVSTHCDPGQVYMKFACYEAPQTDAGDSGGQGGDGASDTDGGAPGDATSCLAHQGFGDTCTAVSQCSCGLDSCNTFMNANYCTHTHCLTDPSICPPGWTCLDVSAFEPATGSVCLRP